MIIETYYTSDCSNLGLGITELRWDQNRQSVEIQLLDKQNIPCSSSKFIPSCDKANDMIKKNLKKEKNFERRVL